jgi:phage shock protein C
MTASASIDPGQLPADASTQASAATPRRLYRSRSNRVFAGVCGGIAEYFGADPTAVRLLAVIIAIFSAIFPLLIAYLIAAIVVPEGESAPGAAPLTATGSVPVGRLGVFFGIVLVFVGVAALADEVFGIRWDVAGPVVLVGLGVARLMSARFR